MSHARKQIRDATKEILLGIAATGNRVLIGQARPLQPDHDPTILIYTPAEESNRDVMGWPPILKREVQLYVELRVTSADAPDDELDAIAVEVENRMAADHTLGGRCINVRYVGAQQAVDASGAAIQGGLRLDYRMIYRTREGQPEALV